MKLCKANITRVLKAAGYTKRTRRSEGGFEVWNWPGQDHSIGFCVFRHYPEHDPRRFTGSSVYNVAVSDFLPALSAHWATTIATDGLSVAVRERLEPSQ